MANIQGSVASETKCS